MRLIRICVEQPIKIDSTIILPEQAGEHVVRVLRLGVGHPIVLFNGDGYEYDALLSSMAKRAVAATVTEKRSVDRESPLAITVAQAICTGEKMDFVLQKSTELGAVRFIPLMTERTEVRLHDPDQIERRLGHWRRVIVSSCEQSGRTRLPHLSEPQKLAAWVSEYPRSQELRIVLHPRADRSLSEVGDIPANITLVIGPEGGFSDRELTLLRAAHFSCVRLGPRILRTESAGLAALAAFNALKGDF